MKSSLRVFLVIVSLVMMVGAFPAALADDAASVPRLAWAGFDLLAETFGPLRIGMPAGELQEVLGDWKQDSQPELWGADGLEHWQVSYDLVEVTVGLSRVPGDEASAMVYNFLAFGPHEWKTARGVGIGDPVELLKSLYQDAIDPEWDSDANQGLLIGSLYGGILAGVQGGLVVSLYFGALAE